MTKITVERAVAAIREAGMNEAAIEAVLAQCTKTQLHEVFLAVTSNDDELATNSMKKEDLVGYYCGRIVAYTAREAFKVMDATAKAEYLASRKYEGHYNEVQALTRLCGLYELMVIASKLGVSLKEIEIACKSGNWGDPAYLLVRELRTAIKHRMDSLELSETVAEVSAASSRANSGRIGACEAVQSLEAERNEQVSDAEAYAAKCIKASNGGFVKFTTGLADEVYASFPDNRDELRVWKILSQHNCQELSKLPTQGEVKAVLMQQTPATLVTMHEELTGETIYTNEQAYTERKFFEWFIGTEYCPAEVGIEPEGWPGVTYREVDEAYQRYESADLVLYQRKCGINIVCDEEQVRRESQDLEARYLKLMAEYRKTDMPECQAELARIRRSHTEHGLTVRELAAWNLNLLADMCRRCGLAVRWYIDGAGEMAASLFTLAGLTVDMAG